MPGAPFSRGSLSGQGCPAGSGCADAVRSGTQGSQRVALSPRGTAMKVVAAFLSNALFNFVIGLLLARFLGPADYGRFALAVAAAVMIQTVAFDWARLAATRFYSETVRTSNPALRATIDLTLALIVVLVLAVAGSLALVGFALPMPADYLVLAAGVAVLNGVFDYTTALVRARFDDALYLGLVTGKNVLSLLLTVGGAFWFGSARAALFGVILSMAGALMGAGRRLVDPNMSLRLADRRLAGTLFRYGLPVVLANLFYQTIPLVDRLIIAQRFGLAASGEFSFAYDIGLRVVAAVGSMLDVLLFQLAVRADEHHGTTHARRQVGLNIGVVVAVLAPACAGLWMVLPSFETLVVPAEFHGSFVRNLSLLMPGLFCYGFIFFALNPVFQIEKRTAPLVAVAIGASLINLVALATLPDTLDSFPVGQGIALVLAAVLLIAWGARSGPVWPPVKDILGVGTGTLAVAGAAQLASRTLPPGAVLLTVQMLAGLAVYAGVVLAFDLCGLRVLIFDMRKRAPPQQATR